MRNARFTWYETSDGFYVTDNKTGREACMGDGVDMFQRPSGRSREVGSIRFYRAMNSYFHNYQAEIGEAYFGVDRESL
jgi:hypothetical protein